MHPRLMAVLLGVFLLTGCSGGGGDGDDATDPVDTPTSAPTGTSGPEPGENTPPTASLAASATEGEVPFNVTFTLEGEDADGDGLTWTLDVDGDGVSDADGDLLPAEHVQEYAVGGTYNVTLTVSDGADTATATTAIDAITPAGGPEPLVFEGTVTAPDPFAMGGVCAVPMMDQAGTGVWGQTHELPAGIAAWTFQAEPASAKATFYNAETGAIGGYGDTGTVGEGMTHAMMCASEAQVDYVLTISPP